VESDPRSFMGLRVRLSEHLTQPGDPETVTVPRTWRERFWSWPWRPWQATRSYTHIPQVPYKGALRIGHDTVLMHPVTFRVLREALDANRPV
jgi:hypothetical protein